MEWGGGKQQIKQGEPSFVWPIHIHRPRLLCPAVGQDPGAHKGGMRGEGKNRQKNKRGRKGTTTHPTNSERPFKSEKPARQSVTLISKSNSTPTQLHCARTHTHRPMTSYHSSAVLSEEPAGHPASPPHQSPLHCITKVPPPLTICHPYTSPHPSRVPAWPCPAPLRPPVRRPHSPAVTLALCLFGSVISQL